jgi:hypothetical protein
MVWLSSPDVTIIVVLYVVDCIMNPNEIAMSKQAGGICTDVDSLLAMLVWRVN